MAVQSPAQPGFLTTILHINNLHCSSCLSCIQAVLGALRPEPLSIAADYITHELTVIHSPKQSGAEISRALEDAAFEVRNVQTSDQYGQIVFERDGRGSTESQAQTLNQPVPAVPSSPARSSQSPGINEELNEKHMEYCYTCQSLNEKETCNDFVVSIHEPQSFTASLSIRSMTCAACILSITEGVQQLECLKDVSVSLLTNSATIVFNGPKTTLT